ncbi:sensor histidine kinase [Owenweeksia hongkongensis]|uniref:sensor histidine kinase n=1 Tax=Owenweeksia hongkongensis TaxID=253245 RepID=UPI003A8FC6F4
MSLNHKLKSRFNFTDYISGKDLLENKIFNAATLVFFLLSTATTALASFYESTLWVRLSLSILSLIFLYIFYNAHYKGRYILSSKVFVLLTLLFNDVAWCWSISSTHTANYFFVLIIVVNLTILKVRDHLGFMILTVVNVVVVQYLAYNFPNYILTNPELFEELTFPFPGFYRLMSLVVLISVVLNYFKKSYERERADSHLKSRQLINNNEALRHRNEHLESMARMVSHNLRSPMAGLKMIMNLFDRMETPEDKAELLKNFKDGSQVMFDMVDDFSEILMDYRELVKDLEPLELAVHLENVKKQLASQIKESGAVINADFSGFPEIIYSRLFLESIFLNMISNSIKYAQPDTKPIIEISSYVDDGLVMLTFSDNGIGIDLDRHGKDVFKMYKTFHGKKNVDSKGVGMFITKNQVEIMGGKIDIDSTPNQGTQFYIELYRL